ncbi:hypothetical protein FEM48_Zijuj01G0314300 [Ziziphus jujuba var. spinosa]|uniref:Maternal effect embryo arrest 22 n=1 Tax=Ziziphus jujuba var. spinosa TaxID=714518 RepID=A0A978W694_ZIZJJ|nr:hypothetical protein FEM48_Zijuj01G0314300 [Ziziphus jujuba var. spinosa]
MAADVPVQSSSNPCCAAWKHSYSKLEQKRNYLREAVRILEDQLDKKQKECQEERSKADIEKEKKEKELAARVSLEKELSSLKSARVSLEKELSSLKSEILSIKPKEDTNTEDQNGKVNLLQACVSEKENEINRLKKLIEKETKRADSEKKKTELEKKKNAEAQKIMKDKKREADEEKKLVQFEKERAEEYRHQLEICKKEADEAKLLLGSEKVKLEEANKKLEAEKLKVVKEKKHATSEKAKAEKQRKLAEANKNKAVEEKHYAENLSLQLEEYKKEIDELKKEVHKLRSSRSFCEASGAKPDDTAKSVTMKEVGREAEKSKIVLELSSKLEEANKRFQLENQKAIKEKARAHAEMVKTEEQKRLAEMNWKKAMEEKSRADSLSWQLEENKQKIDELSNKMHEFLSVRKLVESSALSLDKAMDADSMKVKLLKKELKLEKMQKKIAKQVIKLEKSRNSILQHNLGCLKLEFDQFLHQLEMLKKSLSPSTEGTYGLEKPLSRFRMNNLYGSESLLMHLQSRDELLMLMHPTIDPSDNLRQTFQHAAPMSQVSGENCIESITGIDSKLESLLGGSTRTMLTSNAINSSMASFSDGQLVGSQDKGAFSVTTSAKLVGENFQPAISNLSGEDTKVRCSENLAVVDESSVRSPVSTGDVGRVSEHGRKRKRMLDAVESIEHDMLYKKGKASLPKKLLMQNDCDSNGQKRRDKVETEICGYADSPTGIDLIGTAEANREGMSDSVTSDFETMTGFKELADGDYMKLLSLDNDADEESYRAAIEMPLSPTLPEIDVQHVEMFNVDNSRPLVNETFCEVLSNKEGKVLPLCGLDVINMEIGSNKSNYSGSGASCSLMHEYVCCSSSLDIPGHNGNTTKVERASDCLGGELDMSNAPISGDKEGKFPFQNGLRSASESILVHCVISKNIEDRSSISRIYFAIRTCMAHCALVAQPEWIVREILLALEREEQLLAKEKVSVFFSLLLLNFSSAAFAKFGNSINWASIPCLDSFAGHVHSVMSDMEISSKFVKLCCLDDLLSLVEDFLVDGSVMVYEDVSPNSLVECDSRVHMPLDGSNIRLSSLPASTEQLVAGSVILASICAAIDRVGFICETSYNILRICRFNNSLVLTILHIFAHLGGEKFFSLSNYDLMMTVLKSIVRYLEGKNSSDTACCIPSISDAHTKFCLSDECPFSKDYISVDAVTSLLLEKLKINALLGHEDAIKPVHLLKSMVLLDKYKAEESLSDERNHFDIENKADVSANQSDAITSVTLNDFNDLLSLVELVACLMGWEWAYVEVVPSLLKLLESCAIENFTSGIIILLGQLGRLGVDAFGYEDKGVQQLRCNLVTFLCGGCTKKGLLVQIATVTALLGLLSLDFETIIQDTVKFLANSSQSFAADSIKKWFSSLSGKQQDLSLNLLQTGGVNRN